MPRLPRLHVPGAMYHVTARGNHRQDIFFKQADRQFLDDIMMDALERTGARIHAYCWMSNHVHLLVQVADQPLGKLMHRVTTRFARKIQKGLNTTGHLFENRYHALLVDVDSYFLELLRYIHLNPVMAGIVERPHQYRWSSQRAYLGKAIQPWVHTEFGLKVFAQEQSRARTLFQAFVEAGMNRPHKESDFQPHPHERRVLGSDRFLEKLSLMGVAKRAPEPLHSLALRICDQQGVTLEALRSSSRERSLCRTRATIAQLAIEQGMGTLSDVARLLHRDVSTLSRAICATTTRSGGPRNADMQT